MSLRGTDTRKALPMLAQVQADFRRHTETRESLTHEWVAIAREDGLTWAEIGKALRVSKQAAQQRYSG